MTDAGPVPKFLDRRPLVWSFTLLNTYDTICPYQAAERFLYKNVPFVETAPMRVGNEGHKALEVRVGANRPLPAAFHYCEPWASAFDGKGAQTELKLGVTPEGRSCDFWGKSATVWGRGTLDLTIVSETKAYLNDWKFKKPNTRFETPFELEIHAMLLQAKHPHVREIAGTYTYFHDGAGSLSKVYNLSNTLETWNKISGIVRQIETDRAAGQHEKRQGPLCAWCPCFECEHNSNPERS